MIKTDFISRMGTIASETGTAVYAWALMSNHAQTGRQLGVSPYADYANLNRSGEGGCDKRKLTIVSTASPVVNGLINIKH